MDRVITIDRFGVIFRVTTRVARMFGYAHSNLLLGQNVSVLVPPVQSVQHDSYLHQFHEGTRPGKVINSEQTLMAQHAKGFTFPVKLFVFPVRSESLFFLITTN